MGGLTEEAGEGVAAEEDRDGEAGEGGAAGPPALISSHLGGGAHLPDGGGGSRCGRRASSRGSVKEPTEISIRVAVYGEQGTGDGDRYGTGLTHDSSLGDHPRGEWGSGGPIRLSHVSQLGIKMYSRKAERATFMRLRASP